MNHHNDLYVKEQFGMADAQPLATNNVMFLQIWAVFGVTTSMAILGVEIQIKKYSRNLWMRRGMSMGE